MYLSIALISFVLLALQVVLMQALSYVQGHHLAYVVLSVALLGFGAGGAALTLLRRRAPKALDAICAPALCLCALSIAWLPHPARGLLAGLEVDLLLVERGQWVRLIGLGSVALLPFFFGAAALSAFFTARACRIGPMYAANLLGSAAGAGCALPALAVALPEQLTAPLAGLALVAALPLLPRRLWVQLTLLGLFAAVLTAPSLPRSPYKALSYALQLPGAEREGPAPHPYGRVDVVTAGAQRYAPDLSLRYTGEVPAPPHVFVDGDIAGHLLSAEDAAAEILMETPRGAAFERAVGGRVLILSPGGTPSILASAARAERVVAVESHPLLAELTDPLLPEGVKLHRADPRLFLAGGRVPPQDLILFPDRGMFGGPTGLQTLGEDTLFTVEAVRSAFGLLAEGGVLGFNVWLDDPLRHAPRVIDLVVKALGEEGVETPGEHVAVLRGWGSMSIVAGRERLTEGDVEGMRRFSEAGNFDVVWPVGDEERFHGGEDRRVERVVEALLGPERERFLREYRFDVRAPVDDRPFFNQFLRWGETGGELEQLSVSERGLVFLRVLLGLLGVGVLVLVLGPLLPLRASVARAPFTLLTFSGLGAGFMFYEVGLMQRLNLLLGHPIPAAALVITSLLLGMGMGSAWSRRWTASPRLLRGVLVGIVCMHLLLLPVLRWGIPLWMDAPGGWRYVGSGMFLLLTAVPLGVPFPIAIRLLEEREERHIPWACGIDGALAVLVGPAAALLAFHTGFSSLGTAAAIAYLVAWMGVRVSAVAGGRAGRGGR